MIVYHGSIQCVEKPDILHSYRPLDFGKGLRSNYRMLTIESFYEV